MEENVDPAWKFDPSHVFIPKEVPQFYSSPISKRKLRYRICGPDSARYKVVFKTSYKTYLFYFILKYLYTSKLVMR
jgi:hypothetical protein